MNKLKRIHRGSFPHLRSLAAVAVLFAVPFATPLLFAQVAERRPQPAAPTLAALISALRAKSESLKSSPGTRGEYESFLSAHKQAPGTVSYSDFILLHLIFEAARDAGFWNLRWSITDQPPNSDRIWAQWKEVRKPSFAEKTATGECDELSALFAFLAMRAGVKGVGLFWPYPNHTVAVWSVHPANGPTIRVVVPTSQIFLNENDTFDTRGFDPGHQKTIYDYARRDVPDSLELPKPLFDFFLAQLDKYGGLLTKTLQQLRNLREAVIQKSLTPAEAAHEALRRTAAYSTTPDDRAAFRRFADDLNASVNECRSA